MNLLPAKKREISFYKPELFVLLLQLVYRRNKAVRVCAV